MDSRNTEHKEKMVEVYKRTRVLNSLSLVLEIMKPIINSSGNCT
jgi:hypothetical protein